MFKISRRKCHCNSINGDGHYVTLFMIQTANDKFVTSFWANDIDPDLVFTNRIILNGHGINDFDATNTLIINIKHNILYISMTSKLNEMTVKLTFNENDEANIYNKLNTVIEEWKTRIKDTHVNIIE